MGFAHIPAIGLHIGVAGKGNVHPGLLVSLVHAAKLDGILPQGIGPPAMAAGRAVDLRPGGAKELKGFSLGGGRRQGGNRRILAEDGNGHRQAGCRLLPGFPIPGQGDGLGGLRRRL